MKLIASAFAAMVIVSCGSAATETRMMSGTSLQKESSHEGADPGSTLTASASDKTDGSSEKKTAEENAAQVRQRNAVRSSVTIEGLKFKRVFLGGFKNIHFTLYNRYNYPVDQVSLTVHYIKANGLEVHSSSQTVRSIPAHGKIALKAPDFTSSGMSLKVTVEAVSSRALSLCYNINQETFSSDPYRCR